MKKYKHLKYTEEFTIGKGLLEQPILIKRWIFNWKFPFIHRFVKKYTFLSLQKEINNTMNRVIDSRVMDLLKSGYERKTN